MGQAAIGERLGGRSGFLTAGIVVGCAVLFGLWWWGRSSGSRAAPVILISIDTLRADHLPAYGYRKVQTPAIDAFAKDAVVFEQAYAHAPQTLPSHVSILSGRLPFEHGVRDNLGFTIKPAEPLLPAMLRDAGYVSAGFVSAYVLRAETGIGHGFDRYDASLPPSSPEVPVGSLQRDGAATLQAADGWLDGVTKPQFFLFFHVYEPHSPYAPPARFSQYAPYDGEVAYADEIVGRLLASLKRRNFYDDALIVLLSDHGEGLGDHGEQEHGLFLYRETMRVPLMIKLPGQQHGGLRVATPVQHIDVVPTVLDLLRLPPRTDLRGRSLRPLFTGGSIPDHGVYAEAMYPRFHFGWSELYSLTDARYAFIRAPRDELYDLQRDPQERLNLAAERETTRTAMRTALERVIAHAGVEGPGEVSPEVRARLQALGYVGTAASGTGVSNDALPDPKDKVEVLERYRSALASVRAGDFARALTLLRAIVQENPAMADVWSEIGGLELRRGDRVAALAAYKRLVDVAPHDPSALINVADVLLQLGRLDEAHEQASLAAAVIPATDARWAAKAHQALAGIALARKDVAGAREEAAAARAIDPTLPLPDYIEGLIRYNANEFDAAVPFFERALRVSATNTVQMPELRYYLGDSLARLERYAEAEPVLIEEMNLFPYDLRARAALAMLFRATGRVGLSNRMVESIVRVSPTAEGFSLTARLWAMFGEPARATAARPQR
jgi:arylsulfatase A-like enzyme/Tfp pilus assembly protein PilF